MSKKLMIEKEVQCPKSNVQSLVCLVERSCQVRQPTPHHRRPDFGLWTLDFGLTKHMLDRVNIPIEETRSYHISAGGAERFLRNGVGHTERSHSCTFA